MRAGARRRAGRLLGALRRHARRRRRATTPSCSAKWPRSPATTRAAYYVSTAVLADPTGKVVATAEGRCHGVIVTECRGAGGFGYDPLFLVPGVRQDVRRTAARGEAVDEPPGAGVRATAPDDRASCSEQGRRRREQRLATE